MTTPSESQQIADAATELVVALKGHSLPRSAESALMNLTRQLKHTPGPWKTFKTFGGVTHIMTENDKSVATLRGYKHPYNTNARLIAAAPELLELLMDAFEESQKGIHFCNMPLISHKWHQQTQALINKIIGEKDGSNS